ncbi:MAG: MFS transporter [Xanthobacteraceae bacterium]
MSFLELKIGGRLEVPSAVGVSLIVQAIIALLGASVPVLAPAIAANTGWNVNLITFYGPILYLAAFLFSFQVPNILRRVGGMGLSLICVGLSGLGLSLFLPMNLTLVAIAPLAIGAANGGMNPATSQILGPRTTPNTAGLIMAIKQTGVPLGGVLAGVVIPMSVLYAGWRGTTICLVLVSLIAIVGLLPTVRWLNGPQRPNPKAFRPMEPIRRFLALEGMPSFIISAMTVVALQQCLRSFFTVYLVHSVGFSLAIAGLAFGVSQAGGILGQILWAVAADRVFRPHTVMGIIGFLLAIAAALTAAFTSRWPLGGIIAVAAFFGLTAAGFIPVVLGEVARRSPPAEIGAMTAGANMFLIASMLIAPLAFGAIASTLSYAAAFVACSGCALAGAVVAVVAVQRDKQAVRT